MNYTDLQAVVIDDTHKLQYTGTIVQEMIARGEALIRAHLESFNFLVQLTDADRVSVGSANYTLPAYLTHLRYVRIAGLPLDKVDETTIFLRKNSNVSTCYVQRSSQIEIAANPALTTAIDIDYMGMPVPLSVAPTNTLLDQYPQLYIEATSVYVFKRAQDFESAGIAMDSMRDMCLNLNRQSKKLLGGVQSANAYNIKFRSSY